MVALGPLYPAQTVVPLAGVATFNVGFTIAEATVEVQIVLQSESLHP